VAQVARARVMIVPATTIMELTNVISDMLNMSSDSGSDPGSNRSGDRSSVSVLDRDGK
jgi:hypothetical protein